MGARLDQLRTARADLAREQERDDLMALMQQPTFLRFLERLSFYGKVAESPKRATTDDTMHAVGWQDFAKAVLQRCASANKGAMGKMVSGHFERLMAEEIDDANARLEDGETSA